MKRRYCPNCDDQQPDFKTVYLYRAYIRVQRKVNPNRYIAIGWYCLKCEYFEKSKIGDV